MLADEDVAELYDRFIRAREQAIIAEIRKVCGIELAAAAAPTEEGPVNELAPDLVDRRPGWTTSSPISSPSKRLRDERGLAHRATASSR
jgi:hypothetical protein